MGHQKPIEKRDETLGLTNVAAPGFEPLQCSKCGHLDIPLHHKVVHLQESCKLLHDDRLTILVHVKRCDQLETCSGTWPRTSKNLWVSGWDSSVWRPSRTLDS